MVGATEAVRGELRHEGSSVRLSYLLPYLVGHRARPRDDDARPHVQAPAPEEVADAVVDAIRRGRVDVWLPWHAGLLHRLATASPRPVMELVTRVLRADRVLEAPDAAARRAYEDRAARERVI